VRACQIIEADAHGSFPAAIELLRSALETRLTRRERAEARFALAYARARTDDLERASDDLDELIASGHRHPTALYLDLWVKVKRRDDAAAAVRYEESSNELATRYHTRVMASLAFTRLGRGAAARREVDDAMHRFEQVKELGVLADWLPDQLHHYPIAVGVELLLEERVRDAEHRFGRALEAAADDPGRALAARIGLLLCRWREVRQGRSSLSVFEGDLQAVVEDCRNLGQDPDQLRDLCLWQAVACIIGWLRRPSYSGLPPEELARLRQRLRAVQDLDPGLSDTYLLDGLIGYRFGGDPERRRGLEALERSCQLGVSVPEVLLAVAEERGRAASPDRAVDDYVALVAAYLSERRAPLELRRRLLTQMASLGPFEPLLAEDLETVEDELPPSVEDLRTRARLMRRRIETMVAVGDPVAETAEVARLLQELDTAVSRLRQAESTLQQTEQQLLLRTGQLLLPDHTRGR
jgi:tetratricopeptide (TPR) repeat protein